MNRTLNQVRENGFALVAALFLIVVLAGLGLFAVHLSSAQQQSTTLTLLGARATAAANTGISYVATRVRTSGIGACINTPLNLTQGALSGFTVNITCTPSTFQVIKTPAVCPPLGNCTTYELIATATYGIYGTPTYVSRRITRTLSDEP